MGLGNGAPAPLMRSEAAALARVDQPEATSVTANTTAATRHSRFLMSLPPLCNSAVYVYVTVVLIIGCIPRGLRRFQRQCRKLRLGRRARQQVPQIDENHAGVSIFWRAGCQGPGIAKQIRILQHELQGPVSWISPKRLCEPDCRFVNHPVLAVGRTGIAVAHQFAAGIDDGVPTDICSAVVGIEERMLGLQLESIDCGTGVKGREAAVGTDNQVGGQAEDPAAAPIAPVVVAAQAEAVPPFQIELYV